MGRPKMTPDEFWKKVNKNGPIPDQSKPEYVGLGECWEWIGCRNKTNYGATSFNWKFIHSHRLAWIFTNGDIPEGLGVFHKCDNPPCCNPSHLFIGIEEDNSKDRDKKGRTSCGEKHSEAVLPNRPRGEGHYSAKLEAADVLEMRRMYAETKIPLAEIASQFGVGYGTAEKAIRGATWKHLGPIQKVTKRAAKLAPDTVIEIRKLRASGTSVAGLATQFGLSYHTVIDIVHRRTWKDLE